MSLTDLVLNNKIISNKPNDHNIYRPTNNTCYCPEEISINGILFVTTDENIDIQKILKDFNVNRGTFCFENENTCLKIFFQYIRPWTQYL